MINIKQQKLEKTIKQDSQVDAIVMCFKDAPIGTRIRYPGDDENIWVVIETYGNGLIVKWEGLKPNIYQSYCSFVDVDQEWSLESKVEVIC